MPPRVRAGEEAHHAAGHSSSSSSDTDYRLESESEPESDAPVEEDDYVAAEHQQRSKSLRQKRLESLWKFLVMTMAYFRASCVKTALNLCKEDDEMLGLLSL